MNRWNKIQSHLRKYTPFVLVGLLTIFLHLWAVLELPQDFDEPIYLQNGADYAQAIQTGNINEVIDYGGTSEHPSFVKLIYGVTTLAVGKNAFETNVFFADRFVSALFGVLGVLITTFFVNPIAGGFLAVHTLAVKYTSQVYLEAIPMAFSSAAIFTFLRGKNGKDQKWYWTSALSLGIVAASKYSYLPVTLTVLAYLAFFAKKTRLPILLLFGGIAVLVFFVLDIHLWHDPLRRLIQSLTFHVQYSQGEHVQRVGYPWYQPFIWIFTSAPAKWHPGVFFYNGFDGIFAVLAMLGLRREWKERKWLVIWFAAGIIFLLAWPTKWPQYALTVTPAICIMAAGSFQQGWKWIKEKESYWGYLSNFLPKPSRLAWILLGAFLLFISLIYLSAAIRLEAGRTGWSTFDESNSSLPSNTVNDLIPLTGNRMLIATDNGAAIYQNEGNNQSHQWTILNTTNTGLVNNDVLSLSVDSQGNMWFGTTAGISHYDGETWKSYRETDLGLESDTIISLATDQSGKVYVGTLKGGSIFDGNQWVSIPDVKGKAVFSILANQDNLWLGVSQGVLEIQKGSLKKIFQPTLSPVNHLILDKNGNLWVATSGSGIARWENNTWNYYTVANSGLPLNSVNWITEVTPGTFWMGTTESYHSGGTPVLFDGTQWHSFTTDNSGASGSEPTVIVMDGEGMIWIGTRSQGIDLYKPRKP